MTSLVRVTLLTVPSCPICGPQHSLSPGQGWKQVLYRDLANTLMLWGVRQLEVGVRLKDVTGFWQPVMTVHCNKEASFEQNEL